MLLSSANSLLHKFSVKVHRLRIVRCKRYAPAELYKCFEETNRNFGDFTEHSDFGNRMQIGDLEFSVLENFAFDNYRLTLICHVLRCVKNSTNLKNAYYCSVIIHGRECRFWMLKFIAPAV